MSRKHSPGEAYYAEVEAPERMHLLGLMLASMLARQLRDPALAAGARKIKRPVVIESSGMFAALCFDDHRVVVRRDPPGERIAARIQGALMVLLDVALGRHRIRHVLSGRLRVRGSPLALLRLLALLRS